MDSIVLIVFGLVYLGMIAGRLPGLVLDRTGVALLGAIILLSVGAVQIEDLPKAIDIPTISLLFGLMILSVQFRLAGSYTRLVREIGDFEFSPGRLLAVIILVTGVLSALLINDVICLAMTPIVIELCVSRRLNPVPFLLAVACASNIGSALTLVGNPQNILVGQSLGMSFSHYLLHSLAPVVLSSVALWLIISWQYRSRWAGDISLPGMTAPPFSSWQTLKGSVLAVTLICVFLFDIWPRDLTALGAAGILLCSRRMRTREILGIVDWQLLVLFISLFTVTFAVNESGILQELVGLVGSAGLNLYDPTSLFVASAVLSNIVSNVPAVMLLLPLAEHPSAGSILALSSTLAGNFIVVGSIANIIVVDQSSRLGVHIGWRQHAATGIPVTVVSLLLAGFWLWLI